MPPVFCIFVKTRPAINRFPYSTVLSTSGLTRDTGQRPRNKHHKHPQGPRSVEPLPPVPVAFLGREARLVLIMHNLHLDLWEVPRHARSFTKGLAGLEDGTLLDGTDATGGDGEGGGGRVQPPVLRLRMEPKTEKGGHLACAAISAAG